MAPPRKRGAKELKANSELSLGDLVLAKVKGFPAWPAKISRPEDWERAPDPKKYFVQFFGTAEIAFVTPADIQAFTSESKSKLSARCQGKTVKYFAQAVKEICEHFEKLQRQNSSDDNSVDPSIDEVTEEDGIELEGTNCEEINGPGDMGPKLQRCSQIKDEMECQDNRKRNNKNSEEGDSGNNIKMEGMYSNNRLVDGHIPMRKPEVGSMHWNSGSPISRQVKVSSDGNSKSVFIGSTRPNLMVDEKITKTESKRSTSSRHNSHPLRVKTTTDETDLPPAKRHCLALEAVSNSVPRKTDLLPAKQRAVRLSGGDDNNELLKTPIDGGFSNKDSVTSLASDSKKRVVRHGESYVRDCATELVQSAQLIDKASSRSVNPSRLDSDKLHAVEAKPLLASSPQIVTGIGPLQEPEKKHSSKSPNNFFQRKAATGGNRGLGTVKEAIRERSNLASNGEKSKSKTTSKSNLLTKDSNENISSLGERFDNCTDDKRSSVSIDSKTPHSVLSMKHLLAAALARKRQAHLPNSNNNHFSHSDLDADVAEQSPNLTRAVESSNNQLENESLEERRVNSGHHESSLSRGNEAAAIRDAFEGAMQTLTRTRESIGRATRMAIDCAKHGIANEVVELLIQKLENEPSLHRRVDLFFLVDSITQCSHNQKGIAGASYIPIVQAALPRLIGSVAPSGADAQENRRQCHKVLRLWLERKVLPGSVLQHWMDDLVNDDTSAARISSSFRRPSRAERAVDDPLREMEGIFVDEYGSNATFQLPGLLSSRVFEEEDEDNVPTNISSKITNTPLSENTPANQDHKSYSVTPSDRHPHILEEVDGELEMEDVSEHHQEDEITDRTHKISPDESIPSPEDSPPLPPGSPPVTPPLPTSPPPPPPPPPPTSPPPQPQPSQPPLSLQYPPPPPPESCPPPPPQQPFLCRQPLPPQPALMFQHVPSLPSTFFPSPTIDFQPPPLLHGIGNTPTSGNQHVHIVSNTHGIAYNSLRPEGDVHLNPQTSQLRQPYMPATASFGQRPLHPEPVPPPQQTLGQFSYTNASVQQYHYPVYSVPNISEGRSYSGRPYSHEGYFGPAPERPPASTLNFPPVPNAQNSVHGALMIPCRPDISGLPFR